MANLGGGGRTGNGGKNGANPKSSPEQKKGALEISKERAVQVAICNLFPMVSPQIIANLVSIYKIDLIKAKHSVDGMNGLKKYLHDHCKVWLKVNTQNFTGHVPASWGKIQLVESGKITRAPKGKKNESRKPRSKRPAPLSH
jgi:hypothetical protein